MRKIYLKTSFHLGHERSAIVAQGSTKISPGEQETLFSFDLVSQSFHNSAFFLDLILTSTSTLLLTFCSFLTHVLLYFTSYRLALLQRPNHLRLAATVTGYYVEFPKTAQTYTYCTKTAQTYTYCTKTAQTHTYCIVSMALRSKLTSEQTSEDSNLLFDSAELPKTAQN